MHVRLVFGKYPALSAWISTLIHRRVENAISANNSMANTGHWSMKLISIRFEETVSHSVTTFNTFLPQEDQIPQRAIKGAGARSHPCHYMERVCHMIYEYDLNAI